ncbi:hypothetical protein D3C80_1725230 [compost metagenome]
MMIRCNPGKRLNSWPKPSPTSNSIRVKPTQIPASSGRLRLIPKLAPALITMMLFGPGVTDAEMANSTTA